MFFKQDVLAFDVSNNVAFLEILKFETVFLNVLYA